MTKEEIIDNIARLNSETWRDREEVRAEIGQLLAELKKALEEEPVYFPLCADCKQKMNEIRKPHIMNAIRRAYNMDEIRKPYDKMKNRAFCEDAVSRKAILKEIPVLWNSSGDKDYCMETLIDFVTDLSPVTPTQCIAKFTFDKDELQAIVDEKVKELEVIPNWIPTSERQPKENGNYLAFYCTNDGTANLEFMMVDHCNAGGGWLHEKNGKKAYTKVIAWMPLPEPYKKSEVINEQDRDKINE